MAKQIEISEILQKIAKNEHVEFNKFRQKLIKDCKKNVYSIEDLLRYLSGFEIGLNDCLKMRVHIEVERAIVVKVLKTIRTEIEIVRYRMNNPGISDSNSMKIPAPAGKWTNPKIDLIVLAYAIKNSVDNGKVTMKALQDCFEYIFQIELGNMYKRVGEYIIGKKDVKTGYFEHLIDSFNHFVSDKLK